MTNDADLMTDIDGEGAFEVQMRGYSRRQVDEFVARSRSQVRDLEERVARAHDETERVRLELTAARQGLAGKPAHEEISERVGQILKLADDEAKAQRVRAQEEIGKQREQAKKEADRIRTEAREQTERMLTAAQEQAENAIATARAEADKMRNSARLETERAINEATKDAENKLATAKAQAKQMMDEATVRASAIHDGAERRLNLLTSRHTETMRRLTEIRDVVTNLVASETSRGSLEEEVSKSVASTLGTGGGSGAAAGARQGVAAEPRRGPTGRAGAREPGQERDKGADMPATPAPPPAPTPPAPGPGHAGQPTGGGRDQPGGGRDQPGGGRDQPGGGRDQPGGGRDARPGAAASPDQPGPGNGSTEAPGGAGGVGQNNVRMLPD